MKILTSILKNLERLITELLRRKNIDGDHRPDG